MDARQLGDISGNLATCKVRDDAFEITWPDGLVLNGKDPRPWDAVMKVLDLPHHSLVQQAMGLLRASKSA